MTYPELKTQAQSFAEIDKEVCLMLMSIIHKCQELGISADECMIMITAVINAPKEKEVYTRNKETKHRIVEGSFYIALKELAQQSEIIARADNQIVWTKGFIDTPFFDFTQNNEN